MGKSDPIIVNINKMDTHKTHELVKQLCSFKPILLTIYYQHHRTNNVLQMA